MQKFKLKVLCLDDMVGFAINQQILKKTLPITPYYFWPVNEAWGQIQLELESKPWIKEKEKIQLLNSVVDLMNCWKKSPNPKNISANKTQLFQNIVIIGCS